MDPMDKAQTFAHRVVQVADSETCITYFTDQTIDFNLPNGKGWTLLMSVCAYGRNDLVGFVVDRTTALDCGSITNRTTVLHLAAMSKNTLVMEELVATAERKHKLQTIIDQRNAHGDTALMMACVAKNVPAVQLLLEMGASMSAVNASGLNALMCAARVGNDPRLGVLSIDEMMEQSGLIVKRLLVHGTDVNVVEKTGGNTALHIAVLSENPVAVASLISNARNLDIALQNKAGSTALDLSKRISAVASVQIQDLLNEKWAQYKTEAARMSAKVEQELMDWVANEARGASDNAKTTGKKTGKKKHKNTKKKAQAARSTINKSSEKTSTLQELNDQTVENANKVTTASSLLDSASTENRLQSHAAATDHIELGVDDREFENDAGPWQIVIPKNRRKELSSKNAEAPRKRNTKSSPRRLLADNNTSAKKPQPSETIPVQEVNSGHSEAAFSTATARKVPLTSQPSPEQTKASMCAPQHSQMALNEGADRTTRSIMSYDMMNRSFHRTFPVAAELEIDVEKFLIASSISDRELETTESLSISQVEVLQESHWQAYHYLTEKKIELTRVLEAQRVEVQFDLQQELRHFT